MSEKNFVAYGDAETVLTGFATDIKAKQPKTLETPITIEGVQKTTVESALQGLVGSVADGKTSIASAITNKGVTTAANASFSTMANNIAQIPTGANYPYPKYLYLNGFRPNTRNATTYDKIWYFVIDPGAWQFYDHTPIPTCVSIKLKLIAKQNIGSGRSDTVSYLMGSSGNYTQFATITDSTPIGTVFEAKPNVAFQEYSSLKFHSNSAPKGACTFEVIIESSLS